MPTNLQSREANYIVKSVETVVSGERHSGAHFHAGAWRDYPLAFPQRDHGLFFRIER